MASWVRRASEFWKSGKDLRTHFGFLKGSRLALQLRQGYVAPRGTRFQVSMPGLPHPVSLRARTSDLRVAREHLLHTPLDIPLDTDPRFIIDAGANIGMTSLFLAHRYPRARILALEVEESNFTMLRENVRPFPNVTPQRRGLWSEPGHVRILNPRGEPWGFRVAGAEPDDPRAIECVDVGSLLEELSAPRIDLFKIDIEGAELAVLSGADLSWLDRVSVLALELHDRFRPGCTDALDRALVGRAHRRETSGEYTVIRFDTAAGYPTVAGQA